jgi:hypothetical protein
VVWYAIGLGVLVGTVVSVALRRQGRAATFDPFTVGEPWRQFAQSAQRSASKLHATVESTPDGPLKNRMTTIVGRLDDGLHETWAIARRGHDIDSMIRRIDPAALRSKLATLESLDASESTEDLAATIDSVKKQLETTERLKLQSVRTADRLRLTQTRLDELVSRAAEVAIGAGDTDAYEHDVDDLVIELEALRQAVEESNRP